MKTTSFTCSDALPQGRALRKGFKALPGRFLVPRRGFRVPQAACRAFQGVFRTVRGGFRMPGLFGFVAILAVGLIASSCIYERPRGDEFYRTLWTAEGLCDELCEGPCDGLCDGLCDGSCDGPGIEGLTVEFLCDGGVSVQADAAAGSIGTYNFDGPTATFSGLTLSYGSSLIILEEALRSGDRMTITWHYSDSQEARTILMHRLSAYPAGH